MMLSSVFLFGLTSHANPIPTPNDIGIVRRMVYNYAGCSADQKTRLGTAFSDAATLATNAFNIDTGSKALDSKSLLSRLYVC